MNPLNTNLEAAWSKALMLMGGDQPFSVLTLIETPPSVGGQATDHTADAREYSEDFD